jgi:hypothetical protein
MSPGQRPSPADLGKAGCSWPPPPAATADHPAQKGPTHPDPLNRIPHHQGTPCPLPPGMIRSRTGRVKGACGAAARALRAPVTRPPARRTRQLSGDREQTQPSLKQSDHDRRNPETNACGHRQMQVRRAGRRCCRCSRPSAVRNPGTAPAPGKGRTAPWPGKDRALLGV